MRKATLIFCTIVIVFGGVASSVIFQPPPAYAQETQLPAPSMRVTGVSSSGVSLSWNSVSGAARYELQAWTSASGWWQLSDNITGTSYRHTGIAAGTSYYYAVRALDAEGVGGAWSSHVSALLTPVATPSLRVSGVSSGGISLSWNAVSGAARYELQAWTSASGWWQLSSNITGTTYRHTGTAAGTEHYYSVRALNGEGTPGAWSNQVSATVPQPTNTPTNTPQPPAATNTPTHTPPPSTSTYTPTPTHTSVPPSKLNLTATGNSQLGTVELRWDAVSGARYELRVRRDGGNGWQQIGNNLQTDTSYTHRDVPAGIAHWYRVRAVNSQGVNGPWSSISVVTLSTPTVQHTATPTHTPTPSIIASTPTPAPTHTPVPPPKLNLTATGNSHHGTVELRWDAVPGALYELYVWRDETNGWQPVGENPKSETSYTHRDVPAGIRHWYTVRAVNSQGVNGPWSNYPDVTLTTSTVQQTATPTPRPTNTPKPKPTSTSEACVRSLGNCSPQPTNTPRPHAATNTPTNTPTWTPTVTPTPTPTNTPTPTITPTASPPTLEAQISGNSVWLQWQFNGADSYDLEVAPVIGITQWHSLDPVLGATWYQHSEIVPGTPYVYRVRAVIGNWSSNWVYTQPITVPAPMATPTPTPIPTPSKLPLKAWPAGFGVVLEYSPSTGAVDSTIYNSFKIERRSLLSGYTTYTILNRHIHVDKDVTVSLWYLYRVQARNEAGEEGPWSRFVAVQAPSLTEQPPDPWNALNDWLEPRPSNMSQEAADALRQLVRVHIACHPWLRNLLCK